MRCAAYEAGVSSVLAWMRESSAKPSLRRPLTTAACIAVLKTPMSRSTLDDDDDDDVEEEDDDDIEEEEEEGESPGAGL